MAEFLKCDAPGCHHVEDVETITAEMIGKPCPLCGASLLTQADWDMWKAVFRPGIEAAEKLGLLKPGGAKPGERGAVRVNFHDGEVRVRLTPPQQP